MSRLFALIFSITVALFYSFSGVFAVTYPAGTPFGETAGGTFRTYFDNMYINYPTCSSASQVVGGFTASGVPICVTPVSSGFFFTGQTNGDTVRFNGTDWVRSNFLYNNGTQIGIGNQAPQATLDVTGNIRINHPSAASGRFLVSDASGIASWTDNIPATSFSISGSVLGSTTYYNGSSWVASTNLFNTGGNIGIGTVNPQALLDINGQIRIGHASAASGRFLVSDASGIASWTDNVVATALSVSGQALGSTMYYNGSSWVASTNLFNTGGNIGIGTLTPAYKLDIVGGDALIHGIRVGRGQGSILSNSVFGYNVAGANVTGSNNSVFGSYGLSSNVSGSNNTAVGVNAGSNLVSGDNNIFIGYNTQPNMGNTSSNQLNIGNWIYGNAGNIGIGVLSPTARLEVGGQIRITGGGAGSGRYLVSDATGLASWTDMVAATTFSISGQTLGATTYYNGSAWVASTNIFNTGGNVGIGTATPLQKLHVVGGDARINGLTIGLGGGQLSTNTALGASALASNTTSEFNTAIGNNALALSTAGWWNTAIGHSALSSNTTGSFNTAIGGDALGQNTSGINNIAVGNSSLYSNITGQDNAGFGRESLRNNVSGTANTAIGPYALYSNTTGIGNTALGNGAFSSVISSWDSVGIGISAGQNLESGGNNIAIGAYTNFASTGASDQLNIGNWIYGNAGNIGIGAPVPAHRLDVLGGDAIVRAGSGFCLGMTASGCVYDWTDLNSIVRSMGTPGYIAKFNSGGLIDNSQLFETGGKLYIGDIPGIISGGATIGYVTIEANGSTNSANPFLTLSENGGQECRLWINGANKLGSNCTWTAGLGGSYDPHQIIKADSAGTDLTGSILYNVGNNLGVGTSSPSTNLHVSGSTMITGNLSLSGQITIAGGTPGAGKILTSNATGLATWTTGFSGTTTASGITGGTQNYIPKFGTGGNGLILSQFFDSGTGVGIGTTAPGSRFEIWSGAVTLFHTRGTNNIGLGLSSTRYQTSGTANVGIGNSSLRSLTTGYSNTAIGDSAGYNTTTGYFNSSLGVQALYSNSIGTWNVALGTQALWTNLSGNYNIAIGGQALYLNSANSNSIAIGYQALRASTANDNIAIGYTAGSTITTGSNNILIGNNTTPQLGNTTSNQLNIGNWIYGNNGAISLGKTTMGSGGYRLDVANGFVNSASGYCINNVCIPNWSGIFDAINGAGNYIPKWNTSGTGLVASRISDNGTDIAISSGALQQITITPANQADYQQVIISTGGVLKKGLTTREKLRIFAVSDYGANNDSVSIQQLCFDTSTNSACRGSAADNPLSNVPNFNDIDTKSYTGGIGEYFPATATRPPMFVSYYTGTYMIVNSYTFHNTSFSTSDLGCNVFPYYSLYTNSGSIPNLAKYDATAPVIFTINNSTAISNVYSSTNLSLPTQKTTRVGSQFISNVFMTPGQALLMTIGVQSCASRADRAMALVVNDQKKMTLSITEL